MRKCDNYLRLYCYKYAPESFKAFFIKGYIQHKHYKEKITIEISLDYNERSECGNAYCCHGVKAAMDVLKRVLRKQERNEKHYVTYGNFYVDNPKQYAFTHDLEVPDDLQHRLYAYKEWKDFLKRTNYIARTIRMQEGQFNPFENNKAVKETIIEEKIDPNRRVKIHFRSNTIYQS